MSIAEPNPRRFTREEYYQMGDVGIFQDQHVELIGGEIIQMPPQKDVHAVTIGVVRAALAAVFGPDVWIREQLPLEIGARSEPEPDLSVCVGPPRRYLGTGHPKTALLVVEVSDTTLLFDRTRKASLYASAGIADYWIVNLVDRRLEVHRDPAPDPSAPFGHGYDVVTPLMAADKVTPLAVSTATIAVADLLP